MQNLPIVPTQVTIKENVCSVDIFTGKSIYNFVPRRQGNALRGS